MTSRTRWPGLAALALVAGCERVPEAGRFSSREVAARPDCPKEWHWDSLGMGMRPGFRPMVPAPTLSGPGEIQNVPEFHDCQRFMVPDGHGGLAYDGIFAIFATSRPGRLDTLALMAPAAPAAQRDLIARAGFRPTAALPSAEIWAPDRRYDPLAIRAGFNCLYLYRAGGEHGPWRARMVAYGFQERDCAEPVDVGELDGPELFVRVDQNAPSDLVPQAARWDWDSVRQEHYIGVYCGSDWCEVGSRDTLKPSKRFLDRRPCAERGKQRVYGIRGWYDEQYLAVQDTAGTAPRPSGILGTLIPDSLLAEREGAAFERTWVRAAEVSLLVPRGVANPYETKLNLAGTDNTSRLNWIDLCHGDTCNGVPIPESLLAVSRDAGWNNWFARITRASDSAVMFRPVSRCDLDNMAGDVPGTARWRWLPTDEMVWVRCSKGCCEIR